MAFLPNIPLSTDEQSISQANILNNFMLLGAIAGNSNPASSSINSSITNSGFNWIYLPPNSATPPAGSAFPTGNVALYSALNGTTSQNELYINKQNQATTVQIPATASILSITSAPAVFTDGWTYLPSGILLKWSANQVANGSTTITFPGAGPAFTTCMTVIVQVADGGAGDINRAIRLTAVTSTNFTVYGSFRTTTGAASMNFTYLAIGY